MKKYNRLYAIIVASVIIGAFMGILHLSGADEMTIIYRQGIIAGVMLGNVEDAQIQKRPRPLELVPLRQNDQAK